MAWLIGPIGPCRPGGPRRLEALGLQRGQEALGGRSPHHHRHTALLRARGDWWRAAGGSQRRAFLVLFMAFRSVFQGFRGLGEPENLRTFIEDLKVKSTSFIEKGKGKIGHH